MAIELESSLFETGPIALLAWDGTPDKRNVHAVLHASENIQNILGYSAKELLDRDIEYSDLILPEDLKQAAENIQNNQAAGRNSFTDQYRVRTKSGRVIWVNDHSQMRFDSNGELEIIYGYISDVTDLIVSKQKVEQLRIEHMAARKSEKSKTQFLANMSHEIRTPMNGVIGMADILSYTELDEEQTEFVQTIVRSGQALLTIINDILDFSKIEAGKLVLESQPFDFEVALHDVATLLRAGLEDVDVDILIRIQPGLNTMVRGDVGRVRQILVNLIGNATKFTKTGHILIDVNGVQTDENVELQIDVTDTGVGIPEEKLDTIFDMFSQADNSTTREFGGTGLGLAISSNLAELMDGGICVKSEVGEGSTFTVSLKLRSEAVALTKTCLVNDVSPKTAIVLDDNQSNLKILKEQLSHRGHKCAVFQSPNIALKALKAAKDKNLKIDFLILDYQMPKIDGAQFYKLIKEQNLVGDIRVIFLTSVCDGKIRQELLDLGAEAVLTKPTSPQNLQDIMQTQPPKTGALSEDISFAEAKLDTEQPLILVAEDNPVNQEVMTRSLKTLGYRAQIVSDGEQAVDYWKLHKPPLILMDISMPKMNGLEATQTIRSLEQKTGTPAAHIIGVTAHAFKSDEERGYAAGMDAYLTKPIVLKTLKRELDVFFNTAVQEKTRHIANG